MIEQNPAGTSDITIGLLLRYVVVGTLNTAASYGAYCLFIFAGMSYQVASLAALVFGIAVSFVTLGRYVFVKQLSGRLPKFLLVWTVLYFVNIGIIGLIISLGANAYLAGLVAAVPTVGLSFLFQRIYVFR